MTRIIRTYLAHCGQASLLAECLAMAGVFALIGMAFAFPTASTKASTNSPGVVDSRAGEQP